LTGAAVRFAFQLASFACVSWIAAGCIIRRSGSPDLRLGWSTDPLSTNNRPTFDEASSGRVESRPVQPKSNFECDSERPCASFRSLPPCLAGPHTHEHTPQPVMLTDRLGGHDASNLHAWTLASGIGEILARFLFWLRSALRDSAVPHCTQLRVASREGRRVHCPSTG
jgi:hypothetical protein